MKKTPIEIDQEALAIAAEVLGTKTKKDTVNAALREVGQRLLRLRALRERLTVLCDDRDYLTVAAVTGQAVKLVADI
jgi:Arc/MetJ family transcription regulator